MTAESALRNRRAALAVWVVLVGLVVIFGAFVGAARATDSSAFCKSCHEMRPYYRAWAAGQHAGNAQCVDCHVDTGFMPRVTHKFVALGEVWSHFTGNTSFPTNPTPEISSGRCRRCHPSVTSTAAHPLPKGFSHAMHEKKAACQVCHPTTGHDVTRQALRAAGILNQSVTTTSPAFQVATVNGGKANVPGHKSVACSRCHDMARTGCAACHTPPKKHPATAKDKPCITCHQPGATFAFKHPGATAACNECHSLPAKHPTVPPGAQCSQCHKRPGVNWSFAHVALGADCASCHRAPAGHFAGDCGTCHRRPGVTWLFAHTGNTGEHSWRSFACAKCHPNGPPQASCTCHGGRAPSGD